MIPGSAKEGIKDMTKTIKTRMHPIMAPEGGSEIIIGGFGELDKSAMFCTVAYGSRYHDMGIADGSILLCSIEAPVSDGDLVTVMEDGERKIYLFSSDPAPAADGQKRILHDTDKIEAKVLCSFNFFD